MFRNLGPGAIGVDRGALDVFAAARQAAFEGLDPDFGPLIEGQSPDDFLKPYREHGLSVGGWGLPVSVQGDEEQFRAGLENLRRIAPAAASVGATRCATWIPSGSDERSFSQNLAFHIDRLRPVAEILAEHGCGLGLEFIGPKTFRQPKKHPFIHTMGGMLELCEAIGTGNTGLLLDSWHWYTSHGTLDDLYRLKDEDVVQVHINDAPAGVPVDEQVDSVREIMGETGVIDLSGFLRALRDIGYTGPVTPEPFSAKLREMAPAEAVAHAGAALKKVWDQALGPDAG